MVSVGRETAFALRNVSQRGVNGSSWLIIRLIINAGQKYVVLGFNYCTSFLEVNEQVLNERC